jgi:glycosyltransferase involved in cell wall biosynthesis
VSDPQLSVIIPVSRPAQPLQKVVDFVREGLAGEKRTFEIVLIVDGELPERLEEARGLAADQEQVHVFHLARRFGEGAALQAGFAATRGAIILTVPAYFQVRADVMHRKDLACGVRVLKREVLDEVALHGVFHRFITVAAMMSGFETREVEAPVHEEAGRLRPHGPLTYARRILDIANLFFLTRFIQRPLRFFGVIGGFLLVPGILICAVLSIQRLLGLIALGDRPLFLFGVILTVLGFQILAIGLLGEIISFSHASRHKSYAVREVVRKVHQG